MSEWRYSSESCVGKDCHTCEMQVVALVREKLRWVATEANVKQLHDIVVSSALLSKKLCVCTFTG